MENPAQDATPNVAESFVRNIGQAMACLYTYIAAKGHAGRLAPFTESELRLLAQLRRGLRLQPQECFCNAQRLALRDVTGQVSYVEGYVCGDFPVGIHHAWLEVNGKVWDPTRLANERRNRNKGRPPSSPYSYFGLVVDKETLSRHVLDTRVYCGVLDGKQLHPDIKEFFSEQVKRKAPHG